MHKSHNPPNVPKPGSYHHGVEVAPNARWLYISGQLGMTPDGKVLDGTAAQAEQAWMNIKNILAAAGVGGENLGKVTPFITQPAEFGVVPAGAGKALGGGRAASHPRA